VRRKNKLILAGVGILVLVGVLGTSTMSATTTFVTPTQLDDGGHDGEWVNLEGAVTDLDASGEEITFEVTDGNASIDVAYDETLPETLQNGRIVVAKGKYDGERLVARQLSVRAHEGSDRNPDGSA
jgi:cytochrome c-type biogenesis protein CcmE